MRDNIRWLLRYVKQLKGLYVLCIFVAVLDLLTSLGMTGIQKWLIDDVFHEGNFDLLTPLLLIFGGLVVLYNGVHLVYFHIRQKNTFLFREKISDDMMKYFYSIPVKKYQNGRIGHFINYLTNDVSNASTTLASFLPDGVINIVRVLILITVVGIASPVILIATSVLCLGYIFLGKYFGHRFKKLGKDVQEARGEVTVQIEEGISSTREVVAYHRMDWEKEKYNKSFSRYFDLVMADGKLKNKELALLEPFRWAITIIAFGYGGYQVILGNMSIGTFVVVFQFAGQLMGAYQELYKFYTRFAKKMANIERIRELVETGEEKQRDLGFPIDHVQTIRLENVDFKYSDETGLVLRDLTLDIPVGKKIAFVGSSGGGKSTIAQLLVRFFDPEAGTIRVNGRPLTEMKESSWRDRVRIVFQEPYLFPDTVRSNLDMGRGFSEEELLAACQAAEIDDVVLGLPSGLDTEIGERGITLSGGQRQRLAIARAILQNPEILILDEATSALDLETERRVQHNIDRLREGQTTIIIAHRLSTVENADWIYVMKDGQVAEQGTHDELMAHGALYKELVYAQLRLEEGA